MTAKATPRLALHLLLSCSFVKVLSSKASRELASSQRSKGNATYNLFVALDGYTT